MTLDKPISTLNALTLFCFGLGYTALHLKKVGTSFTGTSKNGRQGTIPFTHIPKVQQALQHATHILVSIPPIDSEDIVLASYLDRLKKLPHLKWVGYLSATSVYGDYQGEWVNETSLCNPSTQRGRDRMKAENSWLGSGLPVHIFRLSGIYGKGRSVFERLQSNSIKRIEKPGHFFSRIHVEDIAQVLKASMLLPTPGEIFNVADDLPSESKDPIEYACHLLKKPFPPLIPFEGSDLSKMRETFYQDNKKVSNKKIKDYFNIKLKYPTYKDGLLALSYLLPDKLEI